MREKVKSAIENVVVSTPTFHSVSFQPTYINFFYGKNGTGKTSIAGMFRKPDDLDWLDGENQGDYEIRIYDRVFIQNNIQQHGNMPGVFTISEQDAETQAEIEAKTEQKKELDKTAAQCDETKKEKSNTLERDMDSFRHMFWDRTKAIREDYPDALHGLKTVKNFAQEILAKNGVAANHDIQKMETVYKTAYDRRSHYYNHFKTVSVDDLPECDLLDESVSNSSDTEFANFIKAMKSTDWVRQGYEAYHNHTDGKCPYCQQVLPNGFEEEIAKCFDDAYQDKIKQITEFRTSYRNYCTDAWKIFDENRKGEVYPEVSLDKYNALMDSLLAKVKANIAVIDGKLKEPSKPVQLDDITKTINEINVIIEGINAKIQTNNLVVGSKDAKQREFRKKLIEYLRYVLQKDIKNCQNHEKKINDEIAALKKKADDCREESKKLANQLTDLNKQNSNTLDTVQKINVLLHDAGFQGFSLQLKPNVPNVYEVVRPDGKVADNLSEGEKNFIAFLYFYFLVRGSEQPESTIQDKIVVIDDPVSSMDSGTMFIVSALVREMVEICYNAGSYRDTKTSEDFIKQIFILTHNAYFHREVSQHQAKRYEFVNFYIVEKSGNASNVKPCLRDLGKGEWENVNPVQNFYTALWMEYKETNTPVPLMNVMRRILEHYFIQVCGHEGSTLRKTLLEDNRQYFIKTDSNGQIDNSQLQKVSAMISWLNASTNNIVDESNYIDDGSAIDVYKETFKMIFEFMGQEQHYNMMMGIRA